MKMRISAIVAMASNRVIGVKNELPWKIPADLKRFKRLTWGHPILMGRKTFESIGRALPGRRNLVVSRQESYSAEGVEIFSSVDVALKACVGAVEVFVMGGGEIYALSLSQVDRFYVTYVHREFDGDAFFPEFDLAEFQEVEREEGRLDGLDYSFVTLDRIVKK